MKKFGFTLAEALIAMVVIGTVAALSLPAINKLRPDETKIKYLQMYDELCKAVNQVVENYDTNNSLYIDENNEQYPLAAMIDEQSPDFCNSLFNIFNTIETFPRCAPRAYKFKTQQGGFIPYFKTVDGMQWVVGKDDIVARTECKRTSDSTYDCNLYNKKNRHVIFVNVDPNNKNYCEYDANNCQKPGLFKFYVLMDGTVQIADAMGLMYQESRTSFLKSNSIPTNEQIQKIADLDDEANGPTVTLTLALKPKPRH